MNLDDQGSALREQLERLALEPDDELEARYAMRRPARPRGLYWQLRWFAGRIVRSLHAAGVLPTDPWPVRLTHARQRRRARPVLIWAFGEEPGVLREACNGFAELFSRLPAHGPVLVTDVADFAFYSRLGWLIEYVPSIAGEGESYARRKLRFIARLYRGAPAFPVCIGLDPEARAAAMRQLL